MVLWQLGDAFWLSIEGEPYSLLQQELRSRFPQTPILVTTLIEGWLPGYLPPRELYGKGIYQESIALLEPGTLERVIETASLARISHSESRKGDFSRFFDSGLSRSLS